MVFAFAFAVPQTSSAAPCDDNRNEEFRYNWRLRGGLSWIAGLKFPTSGVGSLKNVSDRNSNRLNSELLITSGGARESFYLYRSEIDNNDLRTLESYSGYAWDSKKKDEKSRFDYGQNLVRIQKRSSNKSENRIKPIPDRELRDVLTAIHYLRVNSQAITAPLQTDVYSDGKLYAVVFRPKGTQVLTTAGISRPARVYEIVAAPGAPKKWSGGVKVWISNDDQRMPLRIEIMKNVASLQLDLQSFSSCAQLARK
jgi:hypothetical protein